MGGLSKASVSLAIAVVTDLLPNERRGKGMVSRGIFLKFQIFKNFIKLILY
jgi:hypothetical protein